MFRLHIHLDLYIFIDTVESCYLLLSFKNVEFDLLWRFLCLVYLMSLKRRYVTVGNTECIWIDCKNKHVRIADGLISWVCTGRSSVLSPRRIKSAREQLEMETVGTVVLQMLDCSFQAEITGGFISLSRVVLISSLNSRQECKIAKCQPIPKLV